MSFFKHVSLHEYDLTDKGVSQACYDELVASGNNSTEEQLRVLADDDTAGVAGHVVPPHAVSISVVLQQREASRCHH